MPLSQEEFESILADDSKEINENIVWRSNQDRSSTRGFRVEVNSNAGYPIFVDGWFNPSSGKLSYSIIHRVDGRIYGLDLGADHRNPDGIRVGEKHKNYWVLGSRDKWGLCTETLS